MPIALEPAAGLPDLRGDRMLLREALHNLVVERGRGLRRGARRGPVARARRSPGGGAPLIEIVDRRHRAGHPARPPRRGCSSPGFTTKETGSGIGLAIAERAVTAHHGRIRVDSEDGRGTRVTVTLPTDLAGLAALALWTAAERRVP